MRSGESADSVPRYASVRDYLQVARRRRILIALVTIGFGVVAFLGSIAQSPTFSTTASLQFRDVLEDFRLIAPGDPVPELPAGVRAAQNAELIDRSGITRQVQERLDVDLSVSQLQSQVTARVGTLTNLVVIETTAGSADLAAQIANAYAEEVRRTGSREARDQIRAAERSLARQLQAATRDAEPTAAFEISTLRTQLSRLRTLKQIAEPVDVVETARPPGGPTSPRTSRNVMLGLFVGFFFAVAAAFFRDSLDRRLHSVHEVHEEISLPVLGRVPDTAFGYPGLATGAGRRMTELDFEAFRILRMNLGALNSESPVRSVLVTSGLPEEGKSTVSMALATAAALGGQSVLLVECDLRRPAFAPRLGLKREPGLSDYLTGKASPQEILQTVDMGAPARLINGELKSTNRVLGTVVCIAAGAPVPNSAELLMGERFKRFLAQVTRAYDLVILDSSPMLAVVDPLQLVPEVDGVLVCVRVQQATRDAVRATRSALDNLPGRPTGVVATGLRRGGADSAGYYYYGD